MDGRSTVCAQEDTIQYQEAVAMQRTSRSVVVFAVLTMLVLTIGPASAQEAPTSPEVGVCLAGMGYAPGCDVDQDGDIDIFDIQLPSARWNSSGTYTAGHTHWGETWTGAGGDHGLRLEHTAASGITYGAVGQSASPDGRGVAGFAAAASGINYGVYGSSASTDGRGVYGTAPAASGTTYGVYGRSSSASGRGVYGYAASASGTTYGVYGQTASTAGRGVFGYSTTTTGSTVGVYGLSSSTAGRGVYGHTSAVSGAAYGVSGRSDSADGHGVYGWATAVSGATSGVYGVSDSADGAGVTGEGAYGVYGRTMGGRGVYGSASNVAGTTYGVYGESASTAGRAVYGAATATSGVTYGVYGASASSDGRGVYGYASASSGITSGVYGEADSFDGRGVYGVAEDGDGVVGETLNPSGAGVRGISATWGWSWGVHGESASPDGTGVMGEATAESGFTTGVVGRSDSPDGIGVLGAATATSEPTWGMMYGVFGRAAGEWGTGVYGYASCDDCLYTVGVYGRSDSPDGYAGYFAGNLAASGTKAFVIDHPLDPAHQYLYHYSLEGPAPFNLYRGTAALDSSGAAWVALPAYFEAINTDLNYQLTAVGAAMPNLHVAQKIEGNRFQIAGGVAHKEVSWQVTAVRNDPWVRDHGFRTEAAKPDQTTGTYRYPAGYGQPESLGQDYQRNRQRSE
jgi:hypothetical protein